MCFLLHVFLSALTLGLMTSQAKCSIAEMFVPSMRITLNTQNPCSIIEALTHRVACVWHPRLRQSCYQSSPCCPPQTAIHRLISTLRWVYNPFVSLRNCHALCFTGGTKDCNDCRGLPSLPLMFWILVSGKLNSSHWSIMLIFCTLISHRCMVS